MITCLNYISCITVYLYICIFLLYLLLLYLHAFSLVLSRYYVIAILCDDKLSGHQYRQLNPTLTSVETRSELGRLFFLDVTISPKSFFFARAQSYIFA